ncbi:SDR family NAD(P)-dependent oxidoreductase [Chitinophaga polysaccharea]|uniref:SDR family oxidoreductase n=1 Tax=Chitinophaga TaxID=79328 RepID=UPI001455466F|nr:MULTISPECIES: SDR family NAD(P)-dependent oxidoreductase [Chitinophaga]NLR62548.1 SDR family NAD(P)-dependent oxidoreductase [Chitinophaga polysaccharea]NLU91518.1 SDR family NAD(P)-dependent oxidoreductase [Chitinophaga sp. Ak27]
MKTSGNTVLITGGSAGIGLAIATALSRQHNQVIITGRNQERLDAASRQLPNVTAINCDVTSEKAVNQLIKTVTADFPQLNMLINNAGHAVAYELSASANAFEKAADEMLTNYLSVIQLTEKLLPLLSSQEEAAIVNVSSVVALAAAKRVPTYAASKAALHSYTQALRMSVAPLHVFELMPPLVNTDFSREIGGSKGIPPEQVADALLAALTTNQYEIHVGDTEKIYQLMRSSPASALQALNSNL